MLQQTRQIGHAARLISLSYLLWGIGEGLWFYIQPLYPERLGANPQQIGLALSMLGIGRLLAILPVTLALERYNPRWVMIPGYAAGPLGVLLLILSPSWEFTLPGFFLYGASSAGLIPATMYLSLAADQDETRHPLIELHTILSYSWAAHMAGLIVSPAIGGFLGEAIGLRAVFALSGGWFSLATLTILFIPFFPAERQSRTFSYQSQELLRRPSFTGRKLLFAVIFMAGPLGYVLVPRFLEEVHGYSTNALGMMGMMSALGSTVWSLYLGWLNPWRGLLIGQVLILGAFGMVFLSHLPVLVAFSYFMYGAWLALRPLATSLTAQIVRANQQGFAFAVLDLLYGVTGILAPLLAGLLYARHTNLPLLIAIALTVITISLTVGIIIRRNTRTRQTYNNQWC